jgi:hypothetical protein
MSRFLLYLIEDLCFALPNYIQSGKSNLYLILTLILGGGLKSKRLKSQLGDLKINMV